MVVAMDDAAPPMAASAEHVTLWILRTFPVDRDPVLRMAQLVQRIPAAICTSCSFVRGSQDGAAMVAMTLADARVAAVAMTRSKMALAGDANSAISITVAFVCQLGWS